VLLLSLDTTTPKASCAVARDGVVINEEPIDAARQLALQLPGALRDILDLSGVGLDEVDAFAVATGPGSFTGLRIGIATMQGLAFGTGKPLIGMSGFAALRAVASPAFLGSRIAAWVDAWRGDVYATLFEDGRAIEDAVVAKPSDLLDELAPRGFANDVLFIGDGAETYRDLIMSRLGHAARIADPSTPLLAAVIAMLATIEYKNGHRPAPHAIRPIYVRRSDAELTRARGPQGSAPHRVQDPRSRIPDL
jgi:tRNA threonylcarbamoyladenosine biosynthesis protein TsaB